MPKIIDARGMACPQPVIHTKKALDDVQVTEVTTLVDNEAAKENVTKLAQSLGYEVSTVQKGSEYHLTIRKPGEEKGQPEQELLNASPAGNGKTVILVTAEHLGRGSEELGGVLMKSFLYTLTESGAKPDTMIFINGGVKLTTQGSGVLDHLQKLAGQGVEILSCGTCLDYYGLKEKLEVGAVSNMYTIYELLDNADKVISL